ncbi:hypothetical protein OROGR_027276 [Orobanche gracilis]
MSSQEILKIRDGTPLEAEEILTYRKSPRNGSVWHFYSKLDVPSNVVQKKRVARIIVFKIRPSQEILKIRDGTPLEAERILTYIKKPSKWIVARILVFIIKSSQEILKIRDGTPLEAEGILTYIKKPSISVWHFSSKLDIPSNVVQKKRVARILVFKIKPSQEILKICDDIPSNVVQKKRVAQILVFKIRPSQEILKIRDGTPMEAEGILAYRKSPRNGSVWHFSSKLDVPSKVVQKKRVAWILVFNIRPSQEILKIRDGTPLEAEGILTYRKSPRNGSVWHFSSKLDVPSNVVQKKRMARIIVFKIRPSQEILKIRDGTPLESSQEILKIRDGTPLEAEGILTYIKKPSISVWHFSSKLDIPSNVVQKKRVARILVFKIKPSQEILKIRDVAQILVFKIRPSQEILKIRDGTPMEAEGILTYRKSPRNGSVWHFSSKLDVPSKVVQKKRVAWILVFNIRPSQEIPKIRDGTPLEAEGILTYRKSPRNGSVWHFSSKLDVPSNVVQKKRMARIIVFKIRPSQEILKIRDGTPLESSQEILKIRDGTPLEAEEILTYRKSPRNGSVWHFYSKLDVPSNVVQKKRVARIIVFKIRPSQEILKIRDGTPLEVERILTYIKKPSKWIEILKIRDGTPLEAEGILTYIKKPSISVWHFSSKLDIPSNVVQKKRVARILVFKIKPSQEILKIRDVQKKRVARILVFNISPSQEILKIRDGTPMEAEGILTYRKSPRNGSVLHFSSKLDVPSNVVQKKRVARILVFKIRPSQEILKIRDDTPINVVQKKRVARIQLFKIRSSQEIVKIRDGTLWRRKEFWHTEKALEIDRPSQEILKIRDGTPMEAEGILTYRKSPRNGSNIPSNVVQKKRVAQILVFKIRPSQEILKIRDGTPMEAEGILTYRKSPRNGSVWHFSSKLDVPSKVVQKKRVAWILVFNIRPSQEILKIRDGTPLEAEGILTYRKSPRNGSVWHFSSKLDVPSNVVQKKRMARIIVFKIRPSQEILKIRDGTPLESSQEILKIRDGTPLEAEEILTYRKSPRNGSVWHFYSKLDVPSNVVQKKRVARIIVFKIRPSQEILKIRDGTPLEAEGILTYIKKPSISVWHFSSKLDIPSNVVQKKRVARILVFKIKPSQEILKIRDGTPLECMLDVPSNIVQKKRVARILVFNISPSQEILKIRDGTPMEAEGILTYRKSPRNGSVLHFSSKLDVPSNVVQKKRVARILVFKIRPSQEILKIRDDTPIKLDVPSNVVQKKRVALILLFKIRSSQEIVKIRDGTLWRRKEFWHTEKALEIDRPSQEILKIRDGTPMEAEGILTYRKSPRNGSVWHFSSKLDVPSKVVQKKRVAWILVFKIRPSQEILKICDGTPMESEGILTYRKRRVARILVFKIRPSQEILKIRDGTPMEAEGILTYRKSPRNGSFWHFSSKLDVPSKVVQKKRVARILVFKIRPSQEILKIRDGTPMESEGILTYRKSPRNGSVWHFSSKLDVPSNVVQNKRVARILVFKIRPSQEILKIRDGTPLERRVARILVFKIRPSQEIVKIRDGTLWRRKEFWHTEKSSRNRSVWHFSSKLDIPSNVVQKKRVARILVFKIRPSQEILKIRDDTPMEAEGILTYRKSPRNGKVWHFSSKLDVPSNVVQKKRVARILVFKIRPSQEILKIRDGTPLERRVARILVFKIRPSQEIVKIRDGTLWRRKEFWHTEKSSRNRSVWHFSSKLDIPSNVVQKKRVARILVFKIRPSQEILKIRDGTPMEAEGILIYRKSPRNGSVWHFSSKLDVPSKVVQKKRVARILVFKIRPSQEILKICDGTPMESEGILTYRKSPRNGSVWYFFSKLDIPSNVVQNKRVARILVFKIRPSQEILKIRDGTPMEAEGILTYRKSPRNGSICHFSCKLDVPSKVVQKKRVARILVFKFKPSQEILKIRDGTPMESEGILTYRKSPRNGSVWHFSSKLDVPSNVVQKKRVARILVFKIRPSQEILKIRDGTPLEAEGILTYIKSPRNGSILARILVYKIRPSQEIVKIRDGTLWRRKEFWHTEKSSRNRSVWHFSSKLDIPSNVVQKKRVARILVFKIRPSQEILKICDDTPMEAEGILTYRKSPRNGSVWHFSSKLDVPSNVVHKKRVARILVFKIRPSQEILKICDGTPMESEGILTYRKSHRNGSVWYFFSKLDIPSNVVQNKRVARILVFKIRPSQEILKIRDGTPMEAEGILTYRKSPRNGSVWHFSSKLDFPKILRIRDGTPLEVEGILTYRKSPRSGSVWHFSSKLDVPSNVVQKKRMARIIVFKIRPSQEILKIRDVTPLEWPSQEILKIRDGTPMEAEGIFTYIKSPRNRSVWHFSSKLDVPSKVVQKKRVAWILVFNIRPSQEILKFRDGTPMESEGILTNRKSPRNGSVWHFSSKLDVPSNVVQKKRVARILVFKIRPSQEILKIRDGTPLERRVARILVFKIRPSQEIVKIRDGTLWRRKEFWHTEKSSRNRSVWHFSSKLVIPSNVVQKKRVARILVFKIRPSQEILKIRDGTPMEAEGILTYRKSPRNGSVWHFSSKLDVPSNVVQKKRVAQILVFKIRPSQEILKIRDGTPLERRVARILVFKIRPSQEIVKIRDGTLWRRKEFWHTEKSSRNRSVWHFSSKLDIPSNVVQKKRVARILVFKIRPSQEILKIRDGTPMEAEGILTYRKSPRNGSVWHFSSKLDVPSKVVQKKRVARILVFKIRPSQEILKICDGTPMESEGILTYRKSPRNGSVWHFSSKLDIPSNVVQNKRVARILVFKIRPSQEILKIRDGTPMEAEGILTYRKSPRNGSVWHFSSKLDVPSKVVQKKRVARILVFKIRPSQEILKIRDGTPMESEGILTYRKSPRNGSVWHFSSKLDVPSNVVQKKRVARILVFKIRPSQEILKIRDGTPLEAEGILTYIKSPRNGSIWPSQEIVKIRDGTLWRRKEFWHTEKSSRNRSVWHFSSKLDIPSNVVQKKRVARILVFKIRPSQEILKIRDGTPMEAEGILTYRKSPRNGSVWHFSSKLDVPSKVVQKKRVARILVFKIRPSQEILKTCDGTPMESEGILTYRKSPRNGSVWHFSSKLDITNNVVQNKRVARILVFKIRPSQEILKIRDGTPMEAEGILTYRKSPRNGSVWHFSSKLDVPSKVVQKKRVARILVFKIRPSQEILKIRDGTPMESEGILTYRKFPRNGSVWHFSSKLDVPSNVVQKKRVARILVFKIRPSQEILKIRDGTPLEAEGILTYIKSPRNGSIWPSQEIVKIRDGTLWRRKEFWHTEKSSRNRSVWHFSSKLDIPSNVVQKKRVARILVFKIRPSQEILKIRDDTPMEAEGILTYRKSPRNGSVWHFSSKLDVPSKVVQKKRVARILVFKIRPSQEILKIRDGTPIEPSQEILKIRDDTPMEAEGILTYRKSPRNGSVWHFSSKLDVPSKVVQKKRVARILVFKIRPSQEILKIRDGTPMESEGILTYRKSPRNGSVWHFSSKLDVPSNVVQKKRVARILVFKIRPSQEILKIRDGTPLEAEGILTYIKSPRNGSIWPSQEIVKIRDGTLWRRKEFWHTEKSSRNRSVWHFSSKLDIPSNVVQKKRVARILVFKIRPSQEILKIRDDTPMEAEGILTYRKSPRNGSVWHFSSKLDVPSKVVQKKRVARILVFKIRPSQEILKIRDGTPIESEGILTYRKSP